MVTIPLEELRKRVRDELELPAPQVRRTLRVRAGLSLAEIARTIGVTREAVRLWELGLRQPRGNHLRDYAAILRMLGAELGAGP